MTKALISTIPFGQNDRTPLDLLEKAGIDYCINPLGRKLKEEDLIGLINDYDILIAGTEKISKKVMDCGQNLQFISRVGAGLDGVDLNYARAKGIKVAYTPDAPAPAVAELTLGLILSLCRSIHLSNIMMHNGQWKRVSGRRITESTIGIIGVGRIGSRILKLLEGFNPKQVLLNDIKEIQINTKLKCRWVNKEDLYRESDIITVHTPLNRSTLGMISKLELMKMKSDAILVNTARGGIINECDLLEVLKINHLSGVALDVFENEPYINGSLSKLNNVLLTSHIGSMSSDCRSMMEIEATKEAIRFLKKESLRNLVPEEEYIIQKGL